MPDQGRLQSSVYRSRERISAVIPSAATGGISKTGRVCANIGYGINSVTIPQQDNPCGTLSDVLRCRHVPGGRRFLNGQHFRCQMGELEVTWYDLAVHKPRFARMTRRDNMTDIITYSKWRQAGQHIFCLPRALIYSTLCTLKD